ncbi:protein PIN-LIKES 3 [Vigna radiata var. radiata]|uniref:Protein PIN-LIKES 3 n=1 Tax=Vigna radiata var. radiata TaxID=3916 RepID=A0A3Q0FC05_VIGRR|nr:protein PIN-LIKES 3 [Vigna radiata var. radiata]
MYFFKLFSVALASITKLLLITVLGALLAHDRFDILRENARKHVNAMVYFVFTPALIYSSMSNTLTLKSVIMLWFMPLSILVTYIAGTFLGWLLIKVVRVPPHLHGLVLGCCAAGNLASLPLTVVPAICKQKNNPFGDEAICHRNGLAYASLSMAVGYTYAWSFTFNIVRIYSPVISNAAKVDESSANSKFESTTDPENLLKCSCGAQIMDADIAKPNGGMNPSEFECKVPNGQTKVPEKPKFIKQLKLLVEKIKNMKILIAPSTMAAIMGVTIGIVPQFRKILVGDQALLNVVQDTLTMLGDASVPAMVLLLGANLLKGLKGIGKQVPLIVGIIVVKFVALPAIGVGIVKSAIHFNLIPHEPLYQFVLLLQYALPPAIVVSTITQMFGVGEGECSAIMLATYACSAVLLTLWCTLFMWLVI